MCWICFVCLALMDIWRSWVVWLIQSSCRDNQRGWEMLPKDPLLHSSNILSNSQWIQHRKIKMRFTSLKVSCHSVQLNWDQTISQSYRSNTIAPFSMPFVTCIFSPWAKSLQAACDLLPVPCHTLSTRPSLSPGDGDVLCSPECLGNKLSVCSWRSSGVPHGYVTPRSKRELSL